MHRIDNSRFLLYIEPKKEDKSEFPINDDFTKLMEHAFENAKRGISNYSKIGEPEYFNENDAWKGCHTCDCGEMSDNYDYLLENGMITNSLCVFYLQYYRSSIPKSETEKIYEIVLFYKNGMYRKNL